MAISIPSLEQILLPKKRPNPKGTAYTNTFQPSSLTSPLSLPTYRNHLQDIFDSRVTYDSRSLLKDLVKYDSDASATLHAFLTTANTTPRFYVYNLDGEIDLDGQQMLDNIIEGLTLRHDYTTGFAITKSLREQAEDLRYMILLRGGIGAELVFDKFFIPVEIRHVDMATIEWYEPAPGQYKPKQKPTGASGSIDLDIPNFFVKHYRQNPADIYAESIFVSSINTVAARQQVINDLYRIMQVTGYPRIEATVVEEVLRKNAPSEFKSNEEKMRKWMNTRIAEITSELTNLRPDSVYVHSDVITPSILNDKGPDTSMNVESIIKVLDAQNQAALKTMGTIIGKGEGGVNTASVEARIFSMAADSLNGPVADMFSEMFTLAMRLQGFQGSVYCEFDPVELRPLTELEPQLVARQSRLKQDLSDGLIMDAEYDIKMYGRVRPKGSIQLSGTKFMDNKQVAGTDVGSISPNSDPLGRSITTDGAKISRSKNGGTGK